MDSNASIDKKLLNKFNWGAASLQWIWAIYHRKYAEAAVAFILSNISIYGILIVGVYFGVKGSRWAWESREWRDEKHFIAVQNKWRISGIISLVAMLIAYLLLTNYTLFLNV